MNKTQRLQDLRRLALQNSYHIQQLILCGDYPSLQAVIDLEKYSHDEYASVDETLYDHNLMNEDIPANTVYESKNWYKRINRDRKMGSYMYDWTIG